LVVDAALVAVTRQVPKLVTVSDDPVTTQPSAVPGTAVKVTAPVPDPPVVTRVSAEPRYPVIEETTRAACAPWLSTAVLAAGVNVRVESVAVNVQEPLDVIVAALNVATPAAATALSVPPRLQPVDPVSTIVSVAPVPDVSTLL